MSSTSNMKVNWRKCVEVGTEAKAEEPNLSLVGLYASSNLTLNPDRADDESGRCNLLSDVSLEKFLELIAGKTGILYFYVILYCW